MKTPLFTALLLMSTLHLGCVQWVEHHRAPGSDGGSLPSTTEPCDSAAPFPRAEQTGWRHARAELMPYTGSLVLTTPIELEGVDIPSCISIRSDGVILRQSRISAQGCSASAAVTIDASVSGRSIGTVLEDVEIDGASAGVDGVAAGSLVTLRRVDIHHVSMGVRQRTSAGVTIEDSFLHEVRGAGAVIANGGFSRTTLCHNTLECPDCPAVLMFLGDAGPVQDVRVARNLIDGGNEYAVYAGSEAGKSYPVSSTTVFQGNRWGRTFFPLGGRYGAVVSFSTAGPGNLWLDNAFLTPEEQILP